MSRMEPSPQTTLVILLGASKWPLSNLQGSPAFARSADKIREYFLNPDEFGLSPENWLDLFDNNQRSPNDVDQAIGDFLDTRISSMEQRGTPASDLLFYYIGHGLFASGHDQAYHLAIQSTREKSLRVSAVAMAALAETLKTKARRLRRLVILDCCFAAESFKYMQSAPDQAAIRQTTVAFEEKSKRAGFPTKGTALLCSSGHNVPSLILRNESGTMFSDALVRALLLGDEHQSGETYLSLYELKTLIEEILESLAEDAAPRPEVHSPDQRYGDVANVPFFPNPRAEVHARKAEEERVRKAQEEEAARKAEEERTPLPVPARVKCSSGHENSAGEAFCNECGEPLLFEREQVRKAEEDQARSQPPYPYTAEGLSQSTGSLFDEEWVEEDWDNTMISPSGFPQPTGPLAQQYENGSYGSNYPPQPPYPYAAEGLSQSTGSLIQQYENAPYGRTEWINSPGQLYLPQQQYRPAAQPPVIPPSQFKKRRQITAFDRHTFISDLPFTSFAVWGHAFFLLTGLGSMVDFYTHSTQSLHWAVGTVALATPLAYILAVGTVALATPLAYILSYRKAMNFLTMTILALMSAAAVFGLTAYCSQLDFDHQRTSQLWFNLTRILWLGRQVNFGLILGSIMGGLVTYSAIKVAKSQGGMTAFQGLVLFVGSIFTLIGWPVLAILASIFQWGFGFGYGWDTSLIAAGVGLVAASGLIGSLFIWIRALASEGY